MGLGEKMPGFGIMTPDWRTSWRAHPVLLRSSISLAQEDAYRCAKRQLDRFHPLESGGNLLRPHSIARLANAGFDCGLGVMIFFANSLASPEDVFCSGGTLVFFL